MTECNHEVAPEYFKKYTHRRQVGNQVASWTKCMCNVTWLMFSPLIPVGTDGKDKPPTP